MLSVWFYYLNAKIEITFETLNLEPWTSMAYPICTGVPKTRASDLRSFSFINNNVVLRNKKISGLQITCPFMWSGLRPCTLKLRAKTAPPGENIHKGQVEYGAFYTLNGRGKSHPIFEMIFGWQIEFSGEISKKASSECGLKGRRGGKWNRKQCYPVFSIKRN